LDLKDFFPTITSKHVYSIFKTIGYNKTISTILTKICTFDGILPQGSPCSPKIANLSAWTLDLRIQGYVGKRGINYTRYADDLSFSGLNPANVVKILPMIKTIIQEEKFEVNNKKTRVTGSSRAKIATGLVVTNDSVGIGKNKYKDLRAKIHHLTHTSEQKNITLLNEVRGWLSYLKSVDKKRHLKARRYILELSAKHKTTIVVNLLSTEEKDLGLHL
jgi:RNA-directed DNA polymerase